MTVARGRLRAGLAAPVLFVLAALVTFIALGTWQVERKAWKEALIETLDRRLSAAPTPGPPRELWARLDKADDEFRRVRFSAAFVPDTEALVYTSGSAWRSDVSGPGYWVFALGRLANGDFVAINRGFVAEDHRDPSTRAARDLVGSIDLVGVMRWPEPRGFFVPRDDPGRNLWFVRDHLAIANAKGWQERWGAVAPFFIELEAPEPPSGWPHPGALKVSIRNEHLQYAITWYGLAGVLIIMFAFWLRNHRRTA
jgi:cytochrome oxidase assembly protein ShyY1